MTHLVERPNLLDKVALVLVPEDVHDVVALGEAARHLTLEVVQVQQDPGTGRRAGCMYKLAVKDLEGDAAWCYVALVWLV